MSESFNPHGTTILAVRRKGAVALGGDGQVTLGNTVMKGNARKVRALGDGKVLGGFAGGTADAFTLFERFEGKLEKFGNLTRAAIELAKDWRGDRYLRRLEALLLVGDTKNLFVISGNGDVIEPDHELVAIGSGGPFAQSAARALADPIGFCSPSRSDRFSVSGPGSRQGVSWACTACRAAACPASCGSARFTRSARPSSAARRHTRFGCSRLRVRCAVARPICRRARYAP